MMRRCWGDYKNQMLQHPATPAVPCWCNSCSILPGLDQRWLHCMFFFSFFQANLGFGVVVLQTHITLRNDNGAFLSSGPLKFCSLSNRWCMCLTIISCLRPEWGTDSPPVPAWDLQGHQGLRCSSWATVYILPKLMSWGTYFRELDNCVVCS